MAAAHSAEVFVVIHGSAATNLVFMREGTTLLEIRPFGFGGSEWVEAFYPKITRELDYKIRYFGLNIEDPALSRPAAWEAADTGEPAMWVRDR